MAILRAFAWLRWRVLMNSLERSGARDKLERFSLAIEQLGPIMAAILMVPSAIVLAGAGAYGGWALAQGSPRPIPFEALRFLLLAACVMAIAGPLVLPAGERTNAVRLLLLPISRRMLYAAQAATTVSDPWVLLAAPAVLSVPLGLAAGGAWRTAILAGIAAVLFLLLLIGLSSLASSLIHMIVRDRRRGEMMALVLIMVLPLAAMVPGTLAGNTVDRRASGRPSEMPALIATFQQRVLPLVPSEMFVRTARAAAVHDVGGAAVPLVTLAGVALLLHGAALLVFGRVLDSPGSSGMRRTKMARKARVWRIPGVSPQTSAVAISLIRLAVRTPRGRAILLSPVMVPPMFGLMMWSGASAHIAFLPFADGTAVALFGAFVSLLAILPIAMNQFAVDGAGLTLCFLSPIDDRDLLRGKAIGNGIIAGAPALVFIVGSALIFGGSSSMWMSIALGITAAYLLIAPLAAVLSALFPRTVDLNSVGNGSNAHGAAGLLGFLSIVVAGGLSLLIAIVAAKILRRPELMPVFLLVWCVLCAAVSAALFVPARALLARRRENLALLR